ncbi:unnamed protein product, partial [Ascophyllum nodosum]
GPRHGCSDGGWRVCRNAEDPRAPVPMVRLTGMKCCAHAVDLLMKDIAKQPWAA